VNNEYVDGLRQYDSRLRSPVVVPHNISALRKKILFENNLLEERALHEFSAGKGDGAGVDTGSAPLKPLTSLTPTPTRTPTPTPTPALAGIPVASTNQIVITNAGFFNGTYTRRSAGAELISSVGFLVGTGYSYSKTINQNSNTVLIGPQMSVGGYGHSAWVINYGYADEGSITWDTQGVIFNASTDITTIPTSGWTAEGAPFPLTITAA